MKAKVLSKSINKYISKIAVRNPRAGLLVLDKLGRKLIDLTTWFIEN